jgi:hypothetical protein
MMRRTSRKYCRSRRWRGRIVAPRLHWPGSHGRGRAVVAPTAAVTRAGAVKRISVWEIHLRTICQAVTARPVHRRVKPSRPCRCRAGARPLANVGGFRVAPERVRPSYFPILRAYIQLLDHIAWAERAGVLAQRFWRCRGAERSNADRNLRDQRAAGRSHVWSGLFNTSWTG